MAGSARAGAAALAAAVLLASVSGGTGCGKRPPPEEEKRSQAREAVQRFFAALPGKDCDVLAPMLALAGGEAGGCADVVSSLHRHGYRLVEVLGAEVDGRDPEAVIVRARIEENGRQREAPLRMEHHPGGWKLRL